MKSYLMAIGGALVLALGIWLIVFFCSTGINILRRNYRHIGRNCGRSSSISRY